MLIPLRSFELQLLAVIAGGSSVTDPRVDVLSLISSPPVVHNDGGSMAYTISVNAKMGATQRCPGYVLQSLK